MERQPAVWPSSVSGSWQAKKSVRDLQRTAAAETQQGHTCQRETLRNTDRLRTRHRGVCLRGEQADPRASVLEGQSLFGLAALRTQCQAREWVHTKAHSATNTLMLDTWDCQWFYLSQLSPLQSLSSTLPIPHLPSLSAKRRNLVSAQEPASETQPLLRLTR